jgi:hypothetical protein
MKTGIPLQSFTEERARWLDNAVSIRVESAHQRRRGSKNDAPSPLSSNGT